MKESTVKRELSRGDAISIIALVDALIEEAQNLRASDLHIDPSAKEVRVRFRIDGVLQDVYSFPIHIHPEVISRIKVLARLRTDEHQTTQDGRFRYTFPNTTKNVDIRVSIGPTYHGENAVLRLLSDSAAAHTLETLGFSATDAEKIAQAIRHTSGMVLSTGPTGSGKTTTLYTLMKMLNSPEVSIVTIEDPIEYAVENIKQIPVNARAGLTFANGLRSILRQDPDIIMVGEVRDVETANIAVNTALTGHLLLSTLHTNDAATTLPRLLDMGIEPYLVASTINIAIGQRLVRRICEACKEPVVLTSIQQSAINRMAATAPLRADTVFRGHGCEFCHGSGYIGRISISEVLVADNDIRESILKKSSSSELKKVAIGNGMTTMIEDGFRKAEQGLTTIDEVLRIFHE